MKKIVFIVFAFFSISVRAGPIANVEYVHKAIAQYWGITIPYNAALSSPSMAANMEYLLTAIDIANKKLNGFATTSYGTGEYATTFAADTIATDAAVATLIKNIEFPFEIATVSETSSFTIDIPGAAGTFYIDWGDGQIDNVVIKQAAYSNSYSHTYSLPGAYNIRIGGRVTDYTSYSVLSFKNNKSVARISGSLGKLFPTLSNGERPMFIEMFSGCTNMKGSIPKGLFDGVSGEPVYQMFYRTFYNCSGLTGEIPAGLFSGISGAPKGYMFYQTFYNCNGLTGEIPAGLFSGISGTAQQLMFYQTFYNCSGLTGEIPLGVLGNFTSTTLAYKMFQGTFFGCSGLTGPSARQPDGTYLYDYFNTATSTQVGGMYRGLTKLSDYSNIPAAWR